MDVNEAREQFLREAREHDPEAVIAAALEEVERRTLAGFEEPGSKAYTEFLSGFVGFVRFGEVPEHGANEPALYRAMLEAWAARGEPVGPRVWKGLQQMEESG